MERTTQELIELLGDDYQRILGELVEKFPIENQPITQAHVKEFSFYARQLIRAAFAYIEGVIYSVKVKSAKMCIDNEIEITFAERFLAMDKDYRINQKGDVEEFPAKISLSQNLRFAFKLAEKAHETDNKFDPSKEWWSSLKKSIKVRDRLMHPRWPQDLDMTGQEVLDLIKAKQGFDDLLVGYTQAK